MRLISFCFLFLVILPTTARAGRVMVAPPVPGSSHVFAPTMEGTGVPGFRGFIQVALVNLTATQQTIRLKIENSVMSTWGRSSEVNTNDLSSWTRQSDPTQNCSGSAATPLNGVCSRTVDSIPTGSIKFTLSGSGRTDVLFRVQCAANSALCQYEVKDFTDLDVTSSGWTKVTVTSAAPPTGVKGCGAIGSGLVNCLASLGVTLSAGVRVEVEEDKGAVMGSVMVNAGIANFGEATNVPYVLPLNAARAF